MVTIFQDDFDAVHERQAKSKTQYKDGKHWEFSLKKSIIFLGS